MKRAATKPCRANTINTAAEPEEKQNYYAVRPASL